MSDQCSLKQVHICQHTPYNYKRQIVRPATRGLPPAPQMACLPEVDAIVVGVGRLGLCFALTLERAGLSVVGVDVSSDYCARLNNKAFESDEPRLEDMLRDATRFHATTDLTAAARRARLIFVFVPTPTRGGKQLYDHAHVSSVLQHLNELRLEDTDVVINATVMPGYISTVGRFLLRECPSVTLSYNPAFVAQGDVMDGCVLAVMSPCNRLVPPARTRSRAAAPARYSFRLQGRFNLVLIGAADDRVAAVLESIYHRIAESSANSGRRNPVLAAGGSAAAADNTNAADTPGINFCRMSAESGEIFKLASNCFRTTKITFTNMVADIAERTPGADAAEICSALSIDPSIGILPLLPPSAIVTMFKSCAMNPGIGCPPALLPLSSD